MKSLNLKVTEFASTTLNDEVITIGLLAETHGPRTWVMVCNSRDHGTGYRFFQPSPGEEDVNGIPESVCKAYGNYIAS